MEKRPSSIMDRGMHSRIISSDTASDRRFTGALLEALTELACPAYSEELVLYLLSRYGSMYRKLTPIRIERMVENNLRNYRTEGISLPEPAICTALTAEHGEPIIRLIARTDWPVERRVVAATTRQLQHLLITSRLCELAINKKRHFTNHQVLLDLAATRARGLPDSVVQYKKYDLEGWLSLSLELIKATSKEDEDARERAAARLLALPDFHPVFGMLNKRPEVCGV